MQSLHVLATYLLNFFYISFQKKIFSFSFQQQQYTTPGIQSMVAQAESSPNT